jgi:hypothetical protein
MRNQQHYPPPPVSTMTKLWRLIEEGWRIHLYAEGFDSYHRDRQSHWDFKTLAEAVDAAWAAREEAS